MKNNESSMTSLVSAFSRAFHVKEDRPIIFNDFIAKDFLSSEDTKPFLPIMPNAINFFIPKLPEHLKGKEKEF